MKKNILTLSVLVSGLLFCSCSSSLQEGAPKDVLGDKVYNKLSTQYRGIGDFSDGLAMVRAEGYDSCTFINTKGEEVLPWFVDNMDFKGYKLKSIQNFSNGLALIRVEITDTTKPSYMNTRYGYINHQGEIAIDCKYYDAEDFVEGFAVVRTTDEWIYSYIDTKGDTKFDMTFKHAGSFTKDGLATVANNNGEFGYINKNGEISISFQFEDADDFSEGFAIVETKDEHLKLINTKGETICALPTKYRYSCVKDGMLAFKDDDKDTFGYMDTKGNIVLPAIYEDAEDFKDGKAQVELNDKDVIINKKGEVVEE